MKIKKFSKDKNKFYLVYDNRWIKEFSNFIEAFEFLNNYEGSLDKSNFQIVPNKGSNLNIERFPINEFYATVKSTKYFCKPSFNLIKKHKEFVY